MFVRHGLRDLTTAAAVTALLVLGAASCAPAAASPDVRGSDDGAPRVVASDEITAGAYLVRVGSCDDCHTPGWPESFGTLPDSMRLMGSPVGFSGPWGTSYPANLRLSASNLSGDEWVAMVRGRTGMPPMPWFSMHAMSDADMRAVHSYLVSLGAKGEPAPAPLPPGVTPTTPHIPFVPVVPIAGVE